MKKKQIKLTTISLIIFTLWILAIIDIINSNIDEYNQKMNLREQEIQQQEQLLFAQNEEIINLQNQINF